MRKRKWFIWILAFCLLAGCCGALAEDWPPAGKTEAELRDMNIAIVFNHDYSANGEYLNFSSRENNENATKAKITQLSGDEAFGNAFSIVKESDGIILQYNVNEVHKEGEAEYRLDMESENFYASRRLTAHFIDFESIQTTLKQEKLTCVVGQTIDSRTISDQMLDFSPAELKYIASYFPGRESKTGYRITDEGFTALEEGDYQILLNLELGSNCAEKQNVPITVHAVSQKTNDEEWARAWPPAGKEEAKSSRTGEQLSGVYVCNYDQAENYRRSDSGITLMLYQGDSFDYSVEAIEKAEEVISSRLTLVSGSEKVINAFQMEHTDTLRYDLGNLQAGGEEATIRVDLESEHFYQSVVFTVKLVDFQDIEVLMDTEAFTAAVGTPWVVDEVLHGDALHISPEMQYEGSLRNEAGDYGENVGTDRYSIRWGSQFTASEEGQYPLALYLELGKNCVVGTYPVTLNVVSQEEARKLHPEKQELPAAADETETAISREGGEAFEEIPGDAGSAAGKKLKLQLSQEDKAFTVYSGTGDQFLGYWNIVDYENLKNAWGGEPGWSIRPAEGSRDVIRWYNDATQRDGMRIVAFESGTPSEEGDFASILTCTWNGQTASARIDLHVLPSPVEPEYTVRLGESVKIDLHPYPTDWTAKGGNIQMRVAIITSALDGQETLEKNGNPFFSIRYTGDADPITITPRKSGIYDLEFSVLPAGYTNSSIKVGTRITVQNEDGTVPRSADEIREMEGDLFSYNLESGSQKDQQYAVVTGAKAAEQITIPAEIDGYPVKGISRDFYRSDGIQNKMEVLILEEGITWIESTAFHDCSALKEVYLPESLISIGGYAFEGCTSLETIHLSSGLTLAGIADKAFIGVGLKDIVLSDGTSLADVTTAGYADLISTYSDGWYYQKRADGTAMLTEAADLSYEATEVVIPGEIDGLKVTGLKERIFAHREGLEKAQLPEGLTYIGEAAFYRCTNLKEINLPESLTYIGDKAFMEVAAENLQLPEAAKAASGELWYAGSVRKDGTGKWEYSLLSDGTAAVTGYTLDGPTLDFPAEVDGIPVTLIARIGNTDWDALKTVKKITLPEGLTVLGENVLYRMENLKQITLPSTLVKIGEYAFSSTGIKEIRIPEGVVSIGESAFAHCSALKTVKLPSTLRTIEKDAFAYCELTSVALPEGLETIGDEAFSSHQMKEVVIPASVKRIGNAAFHPNGNKPPKTVTFQNPLTELGKGIFGYSDGYDQFRRAHQGELPSSGSGYNSKNPLNWKDYYADSGSKNIETITINCYPGSTADVLYQYNTEKKYLKWGPEGIRTAPADAVLTAGLYQPEDLIYELIVPEGVEEIAEYALAGMPTLNSITLPSTLKRIGAHAFDDCRGLRELKLPKGVIQIGEACFAGCVGLKQINLPEGITEIPDYAFSGCASLSKVELPKGGLLKIGAYAFSGCTELTDVKLNKDLEAIGEYAFEKTGLKKASVPDSVTSLGRDAFLNCANLTSLVLPKGMTEIPVELCAGCRNLKKVTLPKGVIRIGEAAFAYHNLGSLTLPEGLESIGKNAFLQNSKSVSMAYSLKKTASSLKSLTVPASLQTIEENAFAGCDALTSIKFAKNAQLTEIGSLAFTWCVKLKEITLPDSVVSIGERAFMFCPGLTKAHLGSSIVSIGDEAFLNCEKMKSLTVPDTLTSIGKNLIGGHGEKLTVTCGQGSAMEAWLKTNEPEVSVVYPGKKGK